MTLDAFMVEALADKRIIDLSKFCLLLAGVGALVLFVPWLMEKAGDMIEDSLHDSCQGAAEETEMYNEYPPIGIADAARLMSSEQINKIVASYMKPLPAPTNRTSMHTPPLLREQMDLIRKPTNNGE